MQMNLVDYSSNIAARGYDPRTRTLRVQFKGKGDAPGPVYDYADVPIETWNEFIAAGSAGKYFYAHIKGQFACEKIEG
jgi:hypothetical protein